MSPTINEQLARLRVDEMIADAQRARLTRSGVRRAGARPVLHAGVIRRLVSKRSMRSLTGMSS